MNDSSKYQSLIRAEQKAQTRQRILNGLVSVMQTGLSEITIPAVAQASGVSIPTIYRHFASKEALLEALPEHLGHSLGITPMAIPQNLGEFVAMVPSIYQQLEGKDSLVRAALVSELAAPAREVTVPRRLTLIEHLIAQDLPYLVAEKQVWLRNSLFILASSASVNAFKDYLGVSWQAAAENVAWAMTQLIESCQQPTPEERHDESTIK